MLCVSESIEERSRKHEKLKNKKAFPPLLMDVYHGHVERVKNKIKANPSLIHVRSETEEYFHDIGRMSPGTSALLMAAIKGMYVCMYIREGVARQ